MLVRRRMRVIAGRGGGRAEWRYVEIFVFKARRVKCALGKLQNKTSRRNRINTSSFYGYTALNLKDNPVRVGPNWKL